MSLHRPEENQEPEKDRVKQLLLAWGNGDQSALDQLAPLVDAELRRLARSYMNRERPGHTLQTTALINEAYLRLITDARNVRWQDRAHFFAIAAQLMRRALVDHARKRGSRKRGGDFSRVSFDQALVINEEMSEDLVALDEALTELAVSDQRVSRVVELRFFGGLTVEETAEALEVSPETVAREWRFAKMWLLNRLSGEKGDGT